MQISFHVTKSVLLDAVSGVHSLSQQAQAQMLFHGLWQGICIGLCAWDNIRHSCTTINLPRMAYCTCPNCPLHTFCLLHSYVHTSAKSSSYCTSVHLKQTGMKPHLLYMHTHVHTITYSRITHTVVALKLRSHAEGSVLHRTFQPLPADELMVNKQLISRQRPTWVKCPA